LCGSHPIERSTWPSDRTWQRGEVSGTSEVDLEDLLLACGADGAVALNHEESTWTRRARIAHLVARATFKHIEVLGDHGLGRWIEHQDARVLRRLRVGIVRHIRIVERALHEAIEEVVPDRDRLEAAVVAPLRIHRRQRLRAENAAVRIRAERHIARQHQSIGGKSVNRRAVLVAHPHRTVARSHDAFEVSTDRIKGERLAEEVARLFIRVRQAR